MRLSHLRQADLNLLVVFTALAEERQVTRAAERLLLSQPAVSRALQRLRDMFHDDLLVRGADGYEPTPKGQRLLLELESTLPRLDRLLSGTEFDPATEEATFRIAATDHAAQVLCPALCRSVLLAEGRARFTFVPLHDGTFEAMEKGRVDLLLSADDGYTPGRFARETLFTDEFACVVAAESGYGKSISLKQYLAARHVGVSFAQGMQTIPDKRLTSIGARRECVMWVPYFTTAMRSVAGTDLIATAPARMARMEAANGAVRMARAPAILGGFSYLMAWHPRVEADAAHTWLRGAMAAAARAI